MVKNLGWVELNLRSSLGWLAIQWVATAQAGWWNIPNPCQKKNQSATRWDTLQKQESNGPLDLQAMHELPWPKCHDSLI